MTATMQRQDSLTDQMFDVMCATAEAGNANAARWLMTAFFDQAVTVEPHTPQEMYTEILATERVAVKIGCYDAADYLLRRLV